MITPTDLRMRFRNETGEWPNKHDHTELISKHSDYIEWLENRIIELENGK